MPVIIMNASQKLGFLKILKSNFVFKSSSFIGSPNIFVLFYRSAKKGSQGCNLCPFLLEIRTQKLGLVSFAKQVLILGMTFNFGLKNFFEPLKHLDPKNRLSLILTASVSFLNLFAYPIVRSSTTAIFLENEGAKKALWFGYYQSLS